MTLRLGWFSSARGQGSRRMFEAVQQAIAAGEFDAAIAVVFSNRDRGEAETTDSFFDLVEGAGIPLVTRSSVAYRRDVGGERSRPGEPLPRWRIEYDRLVDADLAAHPFDVGVLAGYMLIFEREFVASHPLLNLHPALPTGPAGMWQEVIRALIREGAEESGVMLHLAVPEVDAGPRVSYCRYTLRDEEIDPLWAQLPPPPGELDDEALDATALFAAVRERSVARESPLVVATLAEFAAGKLRVEDGRILDPSGRPAEPADLTKQVEARLATGLGA